MLSIKKIYRKIRWVIRNFSFLDSFQKTDGAFYYGPVTYNTDGLATCINCDFINDPKFCQAYQAAVDTKPWPGFTLQWRVYVVCFFANHVKNIEGDFVECGVNTGAYAKAVISYTNFNTLGKTYYLMDTFDGLVPELLTEEERKAGLESYLQQYKNVYKRVLVTFQNDQVNIIKGAIPNTLTLCKSEKISFLSIDMNNSAPEIAAAEYFYDKVVSGGVIILDDYGFPQHINQKIAFDSFALQRNIQILSLPTGQGIIIKK